MWWILVSEKGVWIDTDKEYLEELTKTKLPTDCKYVIVPLETISRELKECY